MIEANPFLGSEGIAEKRPAKDGTWSPIIPLKYTS